MIQKQFVAGMVAVLTAGFFASAALAEEGVVRARLSYGLASYTSPSAFADISSGYSTLGLGVTYIFPSNKFIDFATRMSVGGASYNAGAVSGGSVASDQPFSRNENTLTVGMPLEYGLQGNAGLFTANTTYKLAQFGQFSQKMTGLTAGVGKGFPLNEGKSGAVGVNGAVALLNATHTNALGNSLSSNLSYGISMGATYNYMYTKNIGVSADAKFQSYFIKYSALSGDERILSTSVSLVGQF